MKQVKLSDVHHQMLLEISRKWKVSPRDLGNFCTIGIFGC
jgi:hypothetical protein